ncbi:MAG: hypothetical protein KDD00_11030 [Ignavibacteriae bacterium]|nr:hypothetical protein [Ignavibacteriota bacterium]
MKKLILFSRKKYSAIKNVFTFLIIVFLTIAGKETVAQSQWLDHGKGNSASIEIYKPIIPVFESSFIAGVRPEYTTFSGVVFLSGRYEVSKYFTLTAEFPMVNGKWDDTVEIYNEGGFKVGNPYLGMEYYIPETPVMVDFGFRIPITPEGKIQASTYGSLADVDRVEAFVKDIVPFTASVNYRAVSDSKILFKARVGADLWFNTKQLGIYNQPLLNTLYTLQAGYIQKNVHFIFGLNGNYVMDSGTNDPEKQNYIEYGLLVTFPYKNIRPAFSIKVPNAELGDFLNYVLGLNFTYGFD